MKLTLRTKGIRATRSLREHIEKRVRYALSRFGERVRRVRVSLTDINGPRNGVDIRCQIQAELIPRGEAFVGETRSDPYSAVSSASGRVGHAVSRHLGRLHQRRQGRPRTSPREGEKDLSARQMESEPSPR